MHALWLCSSGTLRCRMGEGLMALLIKADGTRQEVKGEKPNGALTWDQIKNAIGGGYVQMVTCNPKVTGGYNRFYCDEEGKLKLFEPNPEATKLSTYTMPEDVL